MLTEKLIQSSILAALLLATLGQDVSEARLSPFISKRAQRNMGRSRSLWGSPNKRSRSAFENPGSDEKQGVKMGVKFEGCDDAETNLEVDWNGSAVNYTCYRPKKPILPNKDVESSLQCVTLAPQYLPQHFCMNKPLSYKDDIPTHGDHRPLWPKFGEYQFVPPQRWLHNIEHGSVVMLYHPCTHRRLVDELRTIVKGCIRKRIITPYDKLSLERPLALVAWGCKLEMAHVDKKEVIEFIKEKGLKGPEGDLPKQGQYTLGLQELAEPVDGSDEFDSVLCPENT